MTPSTGPHSLTFRKMCANGATIVLLMNLAGTLEPLETSVSPNASRHSLLTFRRGLLGMVGQTDFYWTCIKCRMRELCKVTCDAMTRITVEHYVRQPPPPRWQPSTNPTMVLESSDEDDGACQWYDSNWNWPSSSSSSAWARPQQWWSNEWRQCDYDVPNWWYSY